MNWEQEAEAVAKALYPDDSERHRLRRGAAVAGFLYGSGAALTWASNAEAVERAARALYETDRKEYDGDKQWPPWPHFIEDMYRERARAALTAAIGGDDE